MSEQHPVLISKREYITITDQNTSVQRILIGPQKYAPAAHEIISPKRPFIQVNAGQYVIVTNPAKRGEAGQPEVDKQGQVELEVGVQVQRLGPQSFPVYPGEEISKVHDQLVLTAHQALKLRANASFTDELGVHGVGDEWLVKGPQRYIPPIEAKILNAEVKAVTVPASHYALIANPLDAEAGENLLGERRVVSGPAVFFLEPGESLLPSEKGDTLHAKPVLNRAQGLYIQALHTHDELDATGAVTRREEGTTWLVRGPRTFIPHKDARILGEATVISLGEGEGVYVKDWRTGGVRLEAGPQQIVLEPHEELWEKKLPRLDELTIALGSISHARIRKDKSYLEALQSNDDVNLRSEAWRAVVLRLPDNTIAKINSFKDNKFRLVYGPTSTMLGPWEAVSILELSAGSPKRPKELCVATKTLGPDFLPDEVEASTADHTRLKIAVSYKWTYEVTGDPDKDAVIFATPDPVGFACANLASVIREVTAQHRFDDFHKRAGRIIREAIFGFRDEAAGLLNNELVFAENGLRIIAVDLERVEPIDAQIAADLQAAVKTNIGIQLDRAKAAAQAEAEMAAIESARLKNEAERLMQMESEEKREALLRLEAANLDLEAKLSAERAAMQRDLASEAEEREAFRRLAVEIRRLEEAARVLGAQEVAAIEVAKASAAQLAGASKVFVPHGAALHLHESEG